MMGDEIAAMAKGIGATGALGLVAELLRRFKSRADLRAANRSAQAEDKKADAELVTGIAAAFEKQNEGFKNFTDQLQEELVNLRAERKAWSEERHALRNELAGALAEVKPLRREVAKLRGEVCRLTDQLRANGLEPVVPAE